MLRIIAALAAAFTMSGASAQQWPAKPVRVIVNVAPGGVADVTARVLGARLGETLGQPFVIENRAGGDGYIGFSEVARSDPDGYTLIYSPGSSMMIAPHIVKRADLDPTKALVPIVPTGRVSLYVITHPKVPVSNYAEFLAYAKANPGKLNYGSFGNGSSNQLAYELFKQIAGIELVHVPYKGGAPLITALLAGEIQSSLDVYATANPHIRAGKFKLLGVASAKRFSLLPETPTLAEQGYKVEGGTFFAILGPAKMPRGVVDTLNREINRALQLPDVRERLTSLGIEIAGGTPEALAATIAADVQKWAKLVKERNLKFE